MPNSLVGITLGSVLALVAMGCGNGDDASTVPPDASAGDATTGDAKSDANHDAGDMVDVAEAGDAADAGATDAADAADAQSADGGDGGDAATEDAPSDAPDAG